VFEYAFSEELKKTLKKLYVKDKRRYEATIKKIEEVISRDSETIDFYKNLKHHLKEYKRTHIDKSFVLIFKVFKKENFILFDRMEHHDNIYS